MVHHFMCLIKERIFLSLVTIEEEIKFHNLAADIEDYILHY